VRSKHGNFDTIIRPRVRTNCIFFQEGRKEGNVAGANPSFDRSSCGKKTNRKMKKKKRRKNRTKRSGALVLGFYQPIFPSAARAHARARIGSQNGPLMTFSLADRDNRWEIRACVRAISRAIAQQRCRLHSTVEVPIVSSRRGC